MLGFQPPAPLPGQAAQEITKVYECAVSSLFSFEYCELGPGRVSSFTSQKHCLLIPFQERQMHATTLCNGVRRQLVLKPNEMAVTPAGTTADWQWSDDIKIVLIWIEPTTLREFIERDMRTLIFGKIIGGHVKFTDPELVHIAQEIKTAVDSNDVGTKIIIDALARIFLVTLVRNHAVLRTASQDTFRGRLNVDQFRRLTAFIDDNMTEKIAVSDMADVAGMSANSFTRALKTAIGITPAEYLLKNRLNKAREMLRSPDMPLTQIAHDCGFSDHAHMSRAFKNRYGLPPRMFRRKVIAPLALERSSDPSAET